MIQISEQKIIEAAEKNMDDFLKVFTDAYLDAVGGEITAENMDRLNGYQHTLLAFRFFTDEVREGGFVQLIQNGYGGYPGDRCHLEQVSPDDGAGSAQPSGKAGFPG